MKPSKIVKNISFLLIFLFSHAYAGEYFVYTQDNGYFNRMMTACERYVYNYEPLYVYKGDTFVVARLNIVPDSINNFLTACTINNDFRPLKYAVAIVCRQAKEYQIICKSDYLIGDGALLQYNGFIALIRQAFKKGKPTDDYTDQTYFTYFTSDVCVWSGVHKDEIEDYKFVRKYLRRKFKYGRGW